ncbi:unnamed protein product [Arctogadus glacialis]
MEQRDSFRRGSAWEPRMSLPPQAVVLSSPSADGSLAQKAGRDLHAGATNLLIEEGRTARRLKDELKEDDARCSLAHHLRRRQDVDNISDVELETGASNPAQGRPAPPSRACTAQQQACTAQQGLHRPAGPAPPSRACTAQQQGLHRPAGPAPPSSRACTAQQGLHRPAAGPAPPSSRPAPPRAGGSTLPQPPAAIPNLIHNLNVLIRRRQQFRDEPRHPQVVQHEVVLVKSEEEEEEGEEEEEEEEEGEEEEEEEEEEKKSRHDEQRTNKGQCMVLFLSHLTIGSTPIAGSSQQGCCCHGVMATERRLCPLVSEGGGERAVNDITSAPPSLAVRSARIN